MPHLTFCHCPRLRVLPSHKPAGDSWGACGGGPVSLGPGGFAPSGRKGQQGCAGHKELRFFSRPPSRLHTDKRRKQHPVTYRMRAEQGARAHLQDPPATKQVSCRADAPALSCGLCGPRSSHPCAGSLPRRTDLGDGVLPGSLAQAPTRHADIPLQQGCPSTKTGSSPNFYCP